MTPHHGAIVHRDGQVEWNLWAPRAEKVELVLDPLNNPRVHSMKRTGDWFQLQLPDVSHGERYLFRLPDGDFADPASRWQPDGVFGPSAVFNPDQAEWNCTAWTGVSRDDLVIYELHVGTFTEPGTFAAIIERLDDLKSLGVTALELMPVGQFPGERNWGYDGVFPSAVQNSYGGPAELQRLVDHAHQAGLAVILDVVYNHLGPEGNFFPTFGPYFTKDYRTPWGDALNFDGPDSDPVRQYFIENACYWIRDLHLDGLRLDAIHAIYDLSAHHILAEIQQAVQKIAGEQTRIVHLIGESNQNDPRFIDPPDQHGIGLDAVWADELHHCIHTVLTEEREGYFQDFGTSEQLAAAFEKVFVYDGIYSASRRKRHGAPVGDRDRTHFVVCRQNHDQVGNRAKGDRASTYLPEPAQRLGCGLLMVSPCIPLLFMGEEYAEQNPFPFFCSFSDQALIKAVRDGRREEFSAHGFTWEDDIPDPAAEETFRSAKLSWSWPPGSFSFLIRQLYQDLLSMRREWPDLRDRAHTRAVAVGPILTVERGAGEPVVVLANLTASSQPVPEGLTSARATADFSTEHSRYGGPRTDMKVESLLPYELLIYRR